MGLSLLGNVIGNGCYKPPIPQEAAQTSYHFRDHLRRVACRISRDQVLEKNEAESLNKLGEDCAAFLNTKAYDSSAYSQVVSTVSEIIKKLSFPQVISFTLSALCPFECCFGSSTFTTAF